MPEINILALIVAALVPNIIGALYYGPIFGNTWLKSFGKTKAEMEAGNQVLTYIGALLLAFVIAFFLNFILQAVHKDIGEDGTLVTSSFNTFKHGAFHGFFFCLGFVVPAIVSLGLFHKAKASNIFLNTGFWLICFTLMAGIIDVWH
jgi:hypothetical protein